jgi:hypothetical protein
VREPYTTWCMCKRMRIRVKGRKMIAWRGLAMRVSTRLWLAATLSLRRDTALADPLMQQVRPGAQSVCARLVCTQGGSASPKSIGRALRQKVKETARRGRGCWRVWPPVHIGTVINPP